MREKTNLDDNKLGTESFEKSKNREFVSAHLLGLQFVQGVQNKVRTLRNQVVENP